MTHQVAQVDGRSVSFRHEAGASPTLVCLHGSGGNHHTYDRLFGELTGQACIAIDAPGRLGSEGPPLDSVAAMAELLSQFVEAEVPSEYVVVGHSIGGGIAIEHALATPAERLRGIVLLASGARLRVHPMILKLFEQLAASGEPPDPPPGLFEPDSDPALLAKAKANLHLTPSASALADWTACNAFDRMNDVREIAVPTLIIAGTADTLTPPKYAEYLDAQIPDSTLVVLEGAGHMFPVERAAETAQAIRAWGHFPC